ncbi:CGNR zinc finger domain-containing protein [Leucobacter sp. BZR 635]
MHLNPYGTYAVLLAASLANDWPEDRDGIEARTRDFGMTMTFLAQVDDLVGTRAVIDEWLRVVDAATPELRSEILNRQMRDAAAFPQLVNHDDEGWHLHYRDDRQSLPEVLGSVIPVGTALHLTTRGVTRLGRCAAEPCTNVIVDVTRNGRQRFCSVRCANRAAVRRHRARGSGGSSR